MKLSNKYKQKNWSRDTVVAVQTYTYDIWKTRNELLHGRDAKESHKIKLTKSIDRIKTLYKMNRGSLSMDNKRIFKLPLNLSLKTGL